MSNRKHRSPIWSISKEELIHLLEKSNTFTEVLAFFDLKNKGGNYKTLTNRLKHEGLSWDKFRENKLTGLIARRSKIHKKTSDILCENSNHSRHNLKQRLVKENLLEYKCCECGLTDQWNGKKIILQIDHKNGVGDDNRLENLRFMCPNCHSQTDTFAGKRHRKLFRIKIRKITTTKCLMCDNYLYIDQSKFCSEPCCKRAKRKVDRPSNQELLEELKISNYSIIGRKYGVSETAVRKWFKFRDLESN